MFFLVCVVFWCQYFTGTLEEKPTWESECVNVKTLFPTEEFTAIRIVWNASAPCFFFFFVKVHPVWPARVGRSRWFLLRCVRRGRFPNESSSSAATRLSFLFRSHFVNVSTVTAFVCLSRVRSSSPIRFECSIKYMFWSIFYKVRSCLVLFYFSLKIFCFMTPFLIIQCKRANHKPLFSFLFKFADFEI